MTAKEVIVIYDGELCDRGRARLFKFSHDKTWI